MRKRLLTLAIVVITFGFVACNKEMDLTGTTWTASFAEPVSIVSDGQLMDIDPALNYKLTFTDATSGSMECSGTYTILGTTFPTENVSYTFTYTFDGDKNTGAITADGGQHKPFTYDDDTKVLTLTDEIEGASVSLQFKQ